MKYCSGAIFRTLVCTSVMWCMAALPVAAAAGAGRYAPLNPAFLKYMGRTSSAGNETWNPDRPTGYAPSPLDLSHLKDMSVTAPGARELPASYDLRPLGFVTHVKNQKPHGTCWAFATIGSVESVLLRSSGAAQNTESPDFSEMHLAWYAFTGDDAFTMKPVDPLRDPVLDQDGSFWEAAALLSRWTGPVDTADCPYSEERPAGHWSNYTTRKHLTDVCYLLGTPFRTGDADIKNALMKYGGLAFSFYYADAYYAPDTHAYYFNGDHAPNHGVLLVGWDDAFDRTLFSPDAPADGAWIVKNSWGPDWGENGFFHLSYSDTSRMEGVAFVVGPDTNYDSVYYYDPLGWTRSWGGDGPEGWFANIFVAGNGSARSSGARENLAAVSFYTGSPNSTYDVRIHTDVASGDPDSGTLAIAPVTGTITTPGYHTVVLPSEVPLANGERFSVVVRLTTPGFDYPIPIECFVESYSEKATANPGQSFISTDGANWTDFTAEDPTGNVCIKAFTRIVTVSPTPGDKGSGGGCSTAAAEGAPLALLLFVPALLIRK